eukprot:Phypoly_transcript_01931.p1 GENE.Phypoly_transcript_01931~~Phypoly_transcript_01931.p1  ORF type:complete len:971 (+),score=81.51 Phypoly_transcript_01931:136-3048(+)
MDISDNTKNLTHILDVRDWMISMYEEKCSALFHKISSAIIPTLCPQYGRCYKSLLDDCEKKMYELRTCVVSVEVVGFNHYGKNLLCNRLIKKDVLLPMDRTRDKTTPVPLCFLSGPVAQHNNAKLEFTDEVTFLSHLKKAEENSLSWDRITHASWTKYKCKLQDIYERRFEGVTYKTLNTDEITLLSRQPIMVKSSLFSKITLTTHVMGLSRYGIALGETTITATTCAEFERLCAKAQIIVVVVDEPQVQLTEQALNACMQQKVDGKDVIFVLHKKYDSDQHTSSQFNYMADALNKSSMFGSEKIHVLDFSTAGENERNFLAFEHHLANKIAENIRASLICCVERFFQLVSCAEQLLSRFVCSYSSTAKIDYAAQEETFEDKLYKVEKALNKEIVKLKKSSGNFFKDFIKDIIPYLEIHAATCKVQSTEISELRKEVLMSLNSIFRTSFEGLYLEWVLVKRSSFAQCLLDAVTPLLDCLQLEVGRNYPPSPALLLQYAKSSLEQQSEDLKMTVANNGVVVSDALFHICPEDVSLKEKTETSARKSAYTEFLVYLMRIQSDKNITRALGTSAFGISTILKEFMLKNIRSGFATMRSLARVMYPTHSQVDYSMLCTVLYLRDDIMRHVKQLNSMLLTVAEFPTLARMRKVVAAYSFSDPGMCAMCLKTYTRCSHLCSSCCVDLKGQPCPFCNKWSHFSSELHSTVSNVNDFISSLARNEVSPSSTQNLTSSTTNRDLIFTAINKNGKVITEFQNWYTEILNRNDFTSSKATEVFTCFVNAIISKHTPPECRNLPDDYQKIMMKCISEVFPEELFRAVFEIFKKEYQQQEITLLAKTRMLKHYKASSFMKDYEGANVLDQIDLFKAVVEFNKISSCVRPFEKCERVLKTTEIITNMFSQMHVLMGADLFLPCIVFVLVQSDLEHPVAELHFLCNFMEVHCAHFEQYILQTFYSVVVSAASLLDQMISENCNKT